MSPFLCCQTKWCTVSRAESGSVAQRACKHDEVSIRSMLRLLAALGVSTRVVMMRREACNYFQRTGRCRYGADCRFSHEALPAMHYGGFRPHHRPTVAAAATQGFASSDASVPTFQERVWSDQGESGPTGSGGASSRDGSHLQGNVLPFRFMTYNLLADQLAQEHYNELYAGTPHAFIDWYGHRWPLALKEITHWQPDVLCLQEVDHFGKVQEDLSALGYTGLFAGRTGGRGDGCATFWRQSQFHILDTHTIHMTKHNLKDNVALLVALAPAADTRQPVNPGEDGQAVAGQQQTEGSRAVVVGNTHVLFNNKRGDVKLGQIRTALCTMADLAAHLGRPTTACILAGDFNTAPGSGLYRYLHEGHLDLAAHDRRALSGQHEGYGVFQYQRDLRAGRPPLQGFTPRLSMSLAMSTQTSATLTTTQHVVTSAEQAHNHLQEDAHNTGGVVAQEVQVDASVVSGAAAALQAVGALGDVQGVGSGSRRIDRYVGPIPAHRYEPWQGMAGTEQAGSTSHVTAAHTSSTGLGGTGMQEQPAGQVGLSPGLQPPLGSHSPQVTPTRAGPLGSDFQGTWSQPAPHTWPRARDSRAGRTYEWAEDELEAAMGPAASQQLIQHLSVHQFQGKTHYQRQSAYMQAVRSARRHHAREGLLVARHPLHLRSAYVEASGKEPAFTTCHKSCVETVDFIWFTPCGAVPTPVQSVDTAPTSTTPHVSPGRKPRSRRASGVAAEGSDLGSRRSESAGGGSGGGEQMKQVLRAVRVLQVPDSERFVHGMPNAHWASDHVSLIADFELLG